MPPSVPRNFMRPNLEHRRAGSGERRAVLDRVQPRPAAGVQVAFSEDWARDFFTFTAGAWAGAAHGRGGWCTMSLMLFKENTFGAA